MPDISHSVRYTLEVAGASEATAELQRVGGASSEASRNTVGLTAAGVALGNLLVDLVQKAADYAQALISVNAQLYDMSQRLDILPSQLAALDLVLKEDGASTTAFATALNTLNSLVDDAREGSDAAADSLARVGLSVDEVSKMSPEEVFYAIADGMGGVATHGERMAIASDLFGRRMGAQLLPTLERGGEALRNLGTDFQELGMVMEDDAYAAIDAFDDRMLELKATFDTAMAEAIIPMLPQVEESFTALAEAVVKAGPAMVEVFTSVAKIMADMAPTLELLNVVADGWDRLIGVVGDYDEAVAAQADAVEARYQQMTLAVVNGETDIATAVENISDLEISQGVLVTGAHEANIEAKIREMVATYQLSTATEEATLKAEQFSQDVRTWVGGSLADDTFGVIRNEVQGLTGDFLILWQALAPVAEKLENITGPKEAPEISTPSISGAPEQTPEERKAAQALDMARQLVQLDRERLRIHTEDAQAVEDAWQEQQEALREAWNEEQERAAEQLAEMKELQQQQAEDAAALIVDTGAGMLENMNDLDDYVEDMIKRWAANLLKAFALQTLTDAFTGGLGGKLLGASGGGKFLK